MAEEKMKKTHEIISHLVKIAAEGSPKAYGDYLEIEVLDDAEREMLAEEMFQLSDEMDEESYSDAGESIESSEEVILIGLNDHPPLELDCRACGYEDCKEFSEAEEESDIFSGPNCVFRIIDLGLALGNALNTSRSHGLENGISIRGGLAAKHLGLIDSRICLAITGDVKKERSYHNP